MKRILSFFVVMLVVLTSHAVPAYRGLIDVKQPDGTTLNVYLHGDEFFHYKTTEDGFLVKENENGVLEYAELSANNVITPIGIKARPVTERTAVDVDVLSKLKANDALSSEFTMNQRKTAKAKKHAALKAAKVGDVNLAPRGLVILVSYKDKAFQETNTREAMDEMLNGESYGYNGATGSAKQYFSDQSKGAYAPIFDVVGPVTVSQDMSYYGENDSYGNDKNVDKLVAEACSLANTQCEVDFTKYDNDGDGFVDFVYIIYAGYGENAGADPATIWPHNFYMEYYSGGTPIFDGKKVNNYACSSELNGKSGTIRAGIGTFCHEFSHVLGLPDYYDTDNGTNYDNNATPGMWTLMDQGSYNNSGKTPPNYSAYDKYFLGWNTPTLMNAPANVTLNPAFMHDYRVVTAAGTLPSPRSTSVAWYFENRQNLDWDAFLPGHGLLVTKVQYNSSAWYGNKPNNGTPMYYDIVEADGVSTGGDAGDTYPGTSNRTSYTPTGAYTLTSIAEDLDVITFKFMGGASQYTVTFNAGTHGTCATSSLTESASGSGVVLPQATGNANYTFVGWSTSSAALTADAGVAGAKYYPTSNCTLYAVYKNNTEVNLLYDLDGVTKMTGPNAGVIAKNQAYTATFTATSCYETLTDASVAVEVLVGATELTDVYTYNSGTLTISIPAASVTDSVSVTIYASQKPTVTFDLDNCTTTGAVCISRGATYTATVAPNIDYLLSQNDFLITMNGVDLTASTNFTYVGTTLTIPNVTGNLVIVAIAVKDPSKVDCSNYSYAFTAKLATGALTLGAYNWNSTITNTAYLGYDATKGAQMGSSTKPAKLVSLTTAYTNDCCVSKVLVNAAMGTGGDAQLAVYLDGTQVGTTSTLATTNATYTFTLTQPTKGNLEVRLTNTEKAMYIKSIAIEYGSCTITALEETLQSDVMVVSELNGFRLINVPSNSQIRIFDMMGRLLLTDNKADQLYQLSSGVYAIHVTAEGKTYTLKAICN
ncbi:MAG TPA: M6 family metalloprotease domain-containing protein [Paludibacteraceae bacterium]|nr:M6 family metalloprotease domain-containing protein [Paludibacteraceae bacterium]